MLPSGSTLVQGLQLKTMLATMHWNRVREAYRLVKAVYKSKAKPRDGEERKITRMEVVEHPWKRELVRRALERKRLQGPGRPAHPTAETDGEVEVEDEEGEPTADQLQDELEEIDFDDDENDDDLL
jgi:hypothetical protein